MSHLLDVRNFEASGTSQELPEAAMMVLMDGYGDEGSPFIRFGECRICQEEDSLNNLESPCACNGSLKYAHRKCVQHWCNEKGDTNCEICHQPYRHGYTVPPRPSFDETSIDIEELWQISGIPLDLHDRQLLTIAEAEHQFIETEYNSENDNGTAFYRCAALILMAFLLLRHAFSMTETGVGDSSAFFPLFWFRVFLFLLPLYIMIWAISILQRLRQRQEAAALAAARFTIVVQSAHSRGLMVASTSSPAVIIDRFPT